MAEKIVSPGVFINEVDQSFLPAAIATIGAALIGPTAKGPAMTPTVVTDYSDYIAKFGDIIESGSGAAQDSYKYLTSYSAQEYFRAGGETLTVIRIMDGDYSEASASVPADPSSSFASAFTLHTLADGANQNSAGVEGANGLLANGSALNLRWEVSSVNQTKGTFISMYQDHMIIDLDMLELL
jgi:hypothetical protein